MASETLSQFEARLRVLGSGGLHRILLAEGARLALTGEAIAKRNATRVLNVRTGRLRSSIAGSTKARRGGVDIVLTAGGRTGGQDVPYAATHEFGATITPKRSQYLRVPLSRARTGAGVDRFGGNLRVTGAGKFHVQRHGDRLFLADEQGAPWYALVRRVRIPARPYLRPALDDLAEIADRDVADRVADAVLGGVR